MGHRIEISDRTYDELKEYCSLNGLKIGEYSDKLLYEALMLEKYGDVPFTVYKRVPKPIETVVATAETADETKRERRETGPDRSDVAPAVTDDIAAEKHAEEKPVARANGGGKVIKRRLK